MKSKQAAFKAASLLVSAAAALLAVELILRTVGYQPNARSGYQKAPGPNSEYEIRTPSFSHPVRLNSLMMRDREVHKRRAGEYRILALGDSFTFGLGVRIEDAFVRRLEAELPAAYVINGGGPTFAGEAYDFLVKNRPALDPDLVLLQVYTGNDIYDALGYAQRRPEGDPAPARSLLRRPGFIKSLKRSRAIGLAWSALRDFAWDVLGGLGPIDELFLDLGMRNGARVLLLRRYPLLEEEGFKIETAYLGRIDAFCREHGIALALMIIPFQEQILERSFFDGPRYDFRKPNERLSRFARERGLPCIDFLEEYLRMDDPRARTRTLYIPEDGHWTAEGHRHAAKTIAAVLSPLLRRPPRGS